MKLDIIENWTGSKFVRLWKHPTLGTEVWARAYPSVALGSARYKPANLAELDTDAQKEAMGKVKTTSLFVTCWMQVKVRVVVGKMPLEDAMGLLGNAFIEEVFSSNINYLVRAGQVSVPASKIMSLTLTPERLLVLADKMASAITATFAGSMVNVDRPYLKESCRWMAAEHAESFNTKALGQIASLGAEAFKNPNNSPTFEKFDKINGATSDDVIIGEAPDITDIMAKMMSAAGIEPEPQPEEAEEHDDDTEIGSDDEQPGDGEDDA